jgi:hypothetical protein
MDVLEELDKATETVEIEQVLTTEEIQNKIAQLSTTEDEESLKNAMQDLKKALKANPAACAALLPEDIGQMVMYLKKITGKDIEEAAGRKKSKKKNTDKVDLNNLSDTQKQEILDDLF